MGRILYSVFAISFLRFWPNFLTSAHFQGLLIFPDFWPTADLDACTGSVCGRLSLLLSLSPENVFKQKSSSKKSSQNKLLPEVGQYVPFKRFWHKWKEVKQEIGSRTLNAGSACHLSIFGNTEIFRNKQDIKFKYRNCSFFDRKYKYLRRKMYIRIFLVARQNKQTRNHPPSRPFLSEMCFLPLDQLI